MVKSYVLDTSAVFTITKDEDGSSAVEHIFKNAENFWGAPLTKFKKVLLFF